MNRAAAKKVPRYRATGIARRVRRPKKCLGAGRPGVIGEHRGKQVRGTSREAIPEMRKQRIKQIKDAKDDEDDTIARRKAAGGARSGDECAA